MTIRVKDGVLFLGKDSYTIEKKLVKKLDRVVKGVTQSNPKEDALLINEGKEGKGKTNSSIVEAAYFKATTGRDIHLFFKLEALMDFAKRTKEKIIVWDEPSIDSLSRDQLNSLNQDMQRIFMTIRKKRHIFIINYTKFWKFPEYIIVDRSNGMIHMSDSKIGRFFYIRKNRLEFLWNEFRVKHKRAYIKASSFGGSMPVILEKHFNEIGIYVNHIKNATIDDYESQKDLAIESIGEKKKQNKHEEKLKGIYVRLVKFKGMKWAERVAISGLSRRTLNEYYLNHISKEQLEGDV